MLVQYPNRHSLHSIFIELHIDGVRDQIGPQHIQSLQVSYCHWIFSCHGNGFVTFPDPHPQIIAQVHYKLGHRLSYTDCVSLPGPQLISALDRDAGGICTSSGMVDSVFESENRDKCVNDLGGTKCSVYSRMRKEMVGGSHNASVTC